MNCRYALLILIILVAGFGPRPASAAPSDGPEPPIEVQFVSLSGATLDQLSEGQVGSGVLLYYPVGRDPRRPALAVLLEKAPGSQNSTAKVFDTTAGKGFVQISHNGGNASFKAPAAPTITMTAIGGWWVANRVPNYNLDIEVSGPVCAMWGAGMDCGGAGYLGALKPEQPSFRIQTRDPDRLGVPKWDLRSLIPSFPNQQFIRTNYSERECSSPFNRMPSTSPGWPYVALAGGFEQSSGQFQAPIVVDWQQSKITIFSELVTVRHQNCSYALYSIRPVELGKLNSPDFEAPFAFYDLSGKGTGSPNLIIRSGRFPENDPWFVPEALGLASSQRPPFENIRYSWRQGVGDGFFDYKVDLFGFNAYHGSTPIAGGSASIDAPSYRELPGWVVNQQWPAATFIDATGSRNATSEGLYEWPAQGVGLQYLFGTTETPDLSQFQDLPRGSRGELSFDFKRQPFLALSPIDHRMHLVGADSGFWNVDDKSQVRYLKLGNGDIIDGWQVFNEGRLSAQLYHVPGGLLYSDGTRTTYLSANIASEIFRTLPPTNHDEWVKLGEQLDANKRVFAGEDLRAMFEQFAGERLTITGGTMSGFRLTSDGYRFVLDLQPDYELGNFPVTGITGMGRYILEYNNANGQFTARPSSPPSPAIESITTDAAASALESVDLSINLANTGLEDVTTVPLIVTTERSGDRPRLVTEVTVDLLGAEHKPIHASWSPPDAGNWTVKARLYLPGSGAVERTVDLSVKAATGPSWSTVITAGWPSTWPLAYLATLLGLIALPVASGLLLVKRLR